MSDPNTLAGALAAFQAEAPSVAKDKTAKAGQYSYAYADLADVATTAYPIMARHGLSFACYPEHSESGLVLRGKLLHVSGESLVGSLPLSGRTPQEIGSAITYARRYLLGCLTGIVTDADDDGALAQAAPKAERRPPARRPEAQPQVESAPRQAPAQETGELITEAQMRGMRALLAEAGLSDRAEILSYVGDVIGHPIASSKDLTKREASSVIDRLKSDVDR
jgi:hypothetical protein